MRLSLKVYGAGDRVCALVHGFTDDRDTWWRVAPALADRGYRVVCPDLRGHGHSPRSRDYSPAEMAGDLVETLPSGLEFVAGHSLGGRLLGDAVAGLRPQRAIYLDPAWHIGPVPVDGLDPKSLTRADIERMNPRWGERDVGVELASYAAWDPDTVQCLRELGGSDFSPSRPEVPSLIVLADRSRLVTPSSQAHLRSVGFAFRTVRGAGHVLHRDDYDGFMAALDGWT